MKSWIKKEAQIGEVFLGNKAYPNVICVMFVFRKKKEKKKETGNFIEYPETHSEIQFDNGKH